MKKSKNTIAKATAVAVAVGSEKWAALVEELLKHEPCLVTVKRAMRGLGLQPGGDLVDCMEKVWLAMEKEPRTREIYEL